MKRILFGVILAASLLRAAPQEFRGMIDGRVLRKSTSEALPGVLITLIHSGGANSAAISPQVLATLAAQIESIRRAGASREPAERTEARVNDALRKAGITSTSPFTMTDNAGTFTFRDLPEGAYIVRAARDGYFGPPRNGTAPTGAVKTVELNVGQPIANVSILLVQASTVSGHVYPPPGYGAQPMPGASPIRISPVGIYRPIYEDGRELWVLEATGIPDRNLNFRITGIAPGDVYVGAPAIQPPPPVSAAIRVSPARPSGPGTMPAISGPPEIPRPRPAPQPMTLFQSVKDPALATKIVLEEGENRPMDLRLLPAEGLVYPIKGNTGVTYECVQPGGTTTQRRVPALLLIPQNPTVVDRLQSTYTNWDRNAGAFEIRDVPDGSYELIAPCTEPTLGRALIGRTRLDVFGGGVIVDFPISPGVSLFGEFRITGPNGEAVKPDLLDLRLRSLGKLPDDFVHEPNPIVIDPSGQFRAFNVPEERYGIRLNNLPSDAYVEDIRQADPVTGAVRSVFDEGFDLNAKSAPIQIMVHTQGGVVNGIIRTPDGLPAEDATVVLVPPEESRRNVLRYKTATTDAEGRFRMHGIPPGQYTAFAWESIYPSAWMNEKVLEQNKRSGRTVEISRGQPLELQLTLIPAK